MTIFIGIIVQGTLLLICQLIIPYATIDHSRYPYISNMREGYVDTMDHRLRAGFLLMVFLFYLAGTCTAADSYEYLGTLTGGESTIVHDTEDMMMITVHNPSPYVNITKNDTITQISIESLSGTLPINAVTVFSTPQTKSSSLVRIENLSVSDTKDDLTLLVKTLEYNDGVILTPYAEDTVPIQEQDNKIFASTELFFEIPREIPENRHDEDSPCQNCLRKCNGDSQCIIECDAFCYDE